LTEQDKRTKYLLRKHTQISAAPSQQPLSPGTKSPKPERADPTGATSLAARAAPKPRNPTDGLAQPSIARARPS